MMTVMMSSIALYGDPGILIESKKRILPSQNPPWKHLAKYVSKSFNLIMYDYARKNWTGQW